MTLTYNGEDFTWLKSRQNPLNVGGYSFLFSEAIQNFELQYSFIPHSAHNKSHNTQNEIQLKLDSFSQRAHGLTRRLGYLLRLVSKLPKKVIPKKIFADRYVGRHLDRYIGRYVGRHIGRCSTDMSVEMSVEMSVDISVEGCRSSIGRYIDRHIERYVGRYVDRCSTDMSVDIAADTRPIR